MKNKKKNLLVSLTEFTVDSAYSSEWEELINRKSIICEFADRIDAKLFNLVLNNKLDLPSTSPICIDSLAITKSTNGGRIYIKTDDIIYRITVNDIGEFEQIVANYSNTETCVVDCIEYINKALSYVYFYKNSLSKQNINCDEFSNITNEHISKVVKTTCLL